MTDACTLGTADTFAAAVGDAVALALVVGAEVPVASTVGVAAEAEFAFAEVKLALYRSMTTPSCSTRLGSVPVEDTHNK